MTEPPTDPLRFERLVLPHQDAAYNLARYLVRRDAEAADVLQESLLRAWRYFGAFRGGEVLPWFLQIVRNAAYDVLRRRQALPLDEELAMPDASLPDPAAAMIERADAEILREAVDALPAAYREVIVLRELEGLSYKQIADVTGASMGTVMSRLARARRQLQAAVCRHAGEESHHDL